MSRHALRLTLAAAAASVALLVTGCAGGAAPASSGDADEGYVTPGKLTI